MGGDKGESLLFSVGTKNFTKGPYCAFRGEVMHFLYEASLARLSPC